jgi:hypothetical protein
VKENYRPNLFDVLPPASDLQERASNSTALAQKNFIDTTVEWMKRAAEMGNKDFCAGFEVPITQAWIEEVFIPALKKKGYQVIQHDNHGQTLEIRWEM